MSARLYSMWFLLYLFLAWAAFGFTYVVLRDPFTNTTTRMTTHGIAASEVTFYTSLWNSLPIFVLIVGCIYLLVETQKRRDYG